MTFHKELSITDFTTDWGILSGSIGQTNYVITISGYDEKALRKLPLSQYLKVPHWLSNSNSTLNIPWTTDITNFLDKQLTTTFVLCLLKLGFKSLHIGASKIVLLTDNDVFAFYAEMSLDVHIYL